jgi:hypothetical protein
MRALFACTLLLIASNCWSGTFAINFPEHDYVFSDKGELKLETKGTVAVIKSQRCSKKKRKELKAQFLRLIQSRVHSTSPPAGWIAIREGAQTSWMNPTTADGKALLVFPETFSRAKLEASELCR